MWTTVFDTPVGRLHALVGDRGLRVLRWSADTVRRSAHPLAAKERPDHPTLVRLGRQLDQYFAAERWNFDVPLDPIGTPFQLLAWKALLGIPYGGTRSYGEQAAVVGRPKAARAIGAANARNPVAILVPCHRVIGRDGSLTGFAGGTDAKRFLLDHEARFKPAPA